jgi:secondary thiamine-phosphate synthase enzyme
MVTGMESVVLDIDSSHRQIIDLTPDMEAFCRGLGDGICHVFVPHATAGVAIIELGAGSDDDLLTAIGDILPKDDRWRHRHGHAGHGADHVLPAFIAPSISVPVINGRLTLGTWQSVALVDTNIDNPHRNVRLSFLQG